MFCKLLGIIASMGLEDFAFRIEKKRTNNFIGFLDLIIYNETLCAHITFEPPHGKTNNLHRRKQRRKSASQ